jgi:hypothetical protein
MILEMVIIVISVAKIFARISGHIRSGGYYTSPSCLMYKWKLLLIACKESEGFLEICETCLCECSVTKKVMDGVHDSGEFRESLHFISYYFRLKTQLEHTLPL